MPKRAKTSLRLLAAALSLAIFCGSAWLWHRSVNVADYVYRLQATSNGSAMRGFGSYKGAVVVGVIETTAPAGADGASPYVHRVVPVTKGGGMLRVEPDSKVGALGFGVSRGELRPTVPMLSFLIPRQTYRAVYVPYYSIMVVAVFVTLLVVRRGRRV